MAEYDKLPEVTKMGMSYAYWSGLTDEEQQTLASSECIEPNCHNRRWQRAGSFYCEEHAKQHSKDAYMGHRPEEKPGGSGWT